MQVLYTILWQQAPIEVLLETYQLKSSENFMGFLNFLPITVSSLEVAESGGFEPPKPLAGLTLFESAGLPIIPALQVNYKCGNLPVPHVSICRTNHSLLMLRPHFGH